MAQVVPSTLLTDVLPPAAAAPAARTSETLLYELVAAEILPTIDLSRSVRSVLLRPTALARWNRVMTATRVPMFACYNVGVCLGAAAFLVPAHVGQWLALASLALCLPGSLVHVSLMRYDMLLLLTSTYEFWYLSSINAVAAALLVPFLQDARAALVPVIWLGLQSHIMIDASITSLRELLYSTLVVLVVAVAVLAYTTTGRLDGVRDLELLAFNGYRLTARDVIIQCWTTQIVVMIRNVYRRRTARKDQAAVSSSSAAASVVYCLAYRCAVRLRARRKRRSTSSVSSLVSSATAAAIPLGVSIQMAARLHMSQQPNAETPPARRVQLRFLRVRTRFRSSTRQPLGRWLPGRQQQEQAEDEFPEAWRFSLMVLMDVGVLLTVLSFLPLAVPAVRAASFGVTLVFCAFSCAMYQRQLLRLLLKSFDFAFLSVQLTAIHVALCDLYRWDSRSFAVGAAWLWVHWVLTCDSVTPVLKQRWRFRFRALAWIVVLVVLGHVLIVCQVALVGPNELRDRTLVSFKGRGAHTVELRVLPMLLGRLPMTFGWSCRILWRILYRADHELLMLQGSVTYVNDRRWTKHHPEPRARIMLEKMAQQQSVTSLFEDLMLRVTRKMTVFAASIVPAIDSFREHQSVENGSEAAAANGSSQRSQTSFHDSESPDGKDDAGGVATFLQRTENTRLTIIRGQLFDPANPRRSGIIVSITGELP
ncbi:hypothetical protein ATCC90586_005839 [Pythium insidiosum]|nr:hypothetical protein ATCC90586_005839 [Pythium insidiosum]